MNVERIRRPLPARGDRWLPSIVAEAFTLERPVPEELEDLLLSLEKRRPPITNCEPFPLDRAPEA